MGSPTTVSARVSSLVAGPGYEAAVAAVIKAAAMADVGGYTMGIQSEVSSAAELTASEAGGGDSHAWFEKKGTRIYTTAWVHG